MADVFTRRKRSEVMAAIKGRGNRSTEWRLRSRLVSSGIAGWRVNAADVLGKPDFVFESAKIAIFVDGCFWHGCRHCRNIPASNHKFWAAKIDATKKRDQKVTRNLKKSGWRVIRFWEHELKHEPKKCVATIQNALLLTTAPASEHKRKSPH